MLGWELQWDKDLAQLALVARAVLRWKSSTCRPQLPNAAQREGKGKNPGKKRLQRRKPCIFVGRSNWNLSKCILGFLQTLVGSARGPKLPSGSLCLISKLTGVPGAPFHLFSLFFSSPCLQRIGSIQGSIRFQTTRGLRTEFQPGKKRAGLGAWCVGHPQKFQFGKNNSQQHNLLHDSPKITILQKPFRPKLDSTAWDLELSELLPTFSEGGNEGGLI